MVFPPIRRNNMRRKTPPRVFVGGVRKMGTSRMSIRALANTEQVDTLEKVRKLLDNKTGANGESPEEENPRDSRLKVVIRVRPMNARETAANARNIINVVAPNMLVFDPKVEQQEFFFHNRKQMDVTAKKYKNQKFAFDHVYGENTNTVKIFEDVMQPLLRSLLSGINCSVFAYGTTGSGKTFTMLGNQDNPGLVYLSMNELFSKLDDMDEQFETKLAISYFEVYNEQVRDLLNPTGEQLHVREVGNGIDIAKLTFRQPGDVSEMLEMLQTGNSHRSQHPTDFNAESSRSHAILQVHVHMRERFSNMNMNSKTAKLVLVDLAGSEKCAATGSTGARFREGSNINKSLLALSNCISALASGRRYCSFRDSKLTRILKDSLGGNCKTVMITNISPSHTLFDDSLNTLRYAEKAKKISCNAKKNVITVQSCLTQYQKIVEEISSKIETYEADKTEKDLLIKQLLEEKAARDAEIDSLKKQVENLEGEIQYHRFKPRKEEERRPSWLPNPVNIPCVPGFVDILNSHKTTKQKIRPVVEGFLTEFQLKAKRFEKLNDLADATGDQRYKKAARILQKKLQAMITEIAETLRKFGDKKYAPCSFNHRTFWEMAVGALNPSVQITSLQLYNSYINEFKSTDLGSENSLLRTQIVKLLKECMDKESQLKDAALLSNQMKNLLEHYDHFTPSLKEQYDNFINHHSGNSSTVRFADFSEPASPPIQTAETETASEGVSAQVLFETCELEEYFNDILNRLRKTVNGVSGELSNRLGEILDNVVVNPWRSEDVQIIEFHPSLDGAMNTPEMNSSFLLDYDVLQSIENPREELPPPNDDIFILPDPPRSVPTSTITRPPTMPKDDCPPMDTDAANTTVTLTKKLEETFTKDEECVENACPTVPVEKSLASSLKLPSITDIINANSGSFSNLNNLKSVGVASATEVQPGGSQERPVFLPIQLPEGGRPGPVLPSSSSGGGFVIPKMIKPAPTPGPAPAAKGSLGSRISPRLKSKVKTAVNPGLARGGHGTSSTSNLKSRPYPLSRGGKSSQGPK